MERICTKCGEAYPETSEFFTRDRGALRGLSRRCKTCTRARQKAWRERNANATPPEGAMRTCSRCEVEYPATAEHFDRTSSNPWGIHVWCKGCRNESKRERYASDPAYRRRMIDAAIAYQNSRTSGQKARRRPLWSAAARRRKARLRASYGNHTAEDVRRIYDSQMGCCLYCFEPVPFRDVHVDHYIPLAQGGRNDAFNLAIACADCNLSKGPKMPAEFYVRRTESTMEVN